jgi:hypothetical protein
MQSAQDRLRELRTQLAETVLILAKARQTMQSTEPLEFAVSRLRYQIERLERGG